MRIYGLLCLCVVMMVGLVRAQTNEVSLADRLVAENESIRTMRCDIRRETDVNGKSMTTLSRVWFERPDRLRVETVMPDARRIVVNGTTIYKWIEGREEGVALPLADAPENERVQVRKTPGTMDEHLIRLRRIPEEVLPPADGFPVRRGYTPADPHPYTVLSLDAQGRLARFEFFENADQTKLLLRTDLENWREPQPGIWIACVQKTEAKGRDGISIIETLRISGLTVNSLMEASTFDEKIQAAGIKFVNQEEMAEILHRKQ